MLPLLPAMHPPLPHSMHSQSHSAMAELNISAPDNWHPRDRRTGIDMLLCAMETVEGSVSPDLHSDSDLLLSSPRQLPDQRLLLPPLPALSSSAPLPSMLNPVEHRHSQPSKSKPDSSPKRQQVQLSCARCRNIHKRCDEARPCRRCVRAGLSECEDAPPRGTGAKQNTLAMLDDASPPPPRRSPTTGPFRRVRSPQRTRKAIPSSLSLLPPVQPVLWLPSFAEALGDRPLAAFPPPPGIFYYHSRRPYGQPIG